jgi:hypothetical protein
MDMDMDMDTDHPTEQTTAGPMLETLAGPMAFTEATTVDDMEAGFMAIHGAGETEATGTVADVGLATNAGIAHAAVAIVVGADIIKIVVRSNPASWRATQLIASTESVLSNVGTVQGQLAGWST